MTVYAQCRDCGDVHRLRERNNGDVTTTCPSCGEKPHTMGVDHNMATERVERERLADLLHDVRGVGTTVHANVINTYHHPDDIQDGGVESLVTIDGVGETTARNIIDTLDQRV